MESPDPCVWEHLMCPQHGCFWKLSPKRITLTYIAQGLRSVERGNTILYVPKGLVNQISGSFHHDFQTSCSPQTHLFILQDVTKMPFFSYLHICFHMGVTDESRAHLWNSASQAEVFLAWLHTPLKPGHFFPPWVSPTLNMKMLLKMDYYLSECINSPCVYLSVFGSTASPTQADSSQTRHSVKCWLSPYINEWNDFTKLSLSFFCFRTSLSDDKEKGWSMNSTSPVPDTQ